MIPAAGMTGLRLNLVVSFGLSESNDLQSGIA
jgi:hypothetical protein